MCLICDCGSTLVLLTVLSHGKRHHKNTLVVEICPSEGLGFAILSVFGILEKRKVLEIKVCLVVKSLWNERLG
jgi:hypothetical protein